jgi:hypothetical protein
VVLLVLVMVVLAACRVHGFQAVQTARYAPAACRLCISGLINECAVMAPLYTIVLIGMPVAGCEHLWGCLSDSDCFAVVVVGACHDATS